MSNNLESDFWCITEEDFDSTKQLESESQFRLCNGHICQQANFEEYFSGKTMLGSYISGISNIEKPENESWKNEFSACTHKIVNAPNWIGIIVRLNDDRLDLATWEVQNFRRVLNMRAGFLERTFDAVSTKDRHIQVTVKRMLSMAETEVGAITYSVKSINFEGRISFMPILDGDLKDQLLNENEPIWNVLQTKTQQDVAHLWVHIRRTDFHVCTALTYVLYKNNEQLHIIPAKIEKEKVAGFSTGTDVKKGDTLCLNKYVAIITSLNHPKNELTELACNLARAAKQKGWNKLFEEHAAAWNEKWTEQESNIFDNTQSQQIDRYKIFRKLQGFDRND